MEAQTLIGTYSVNYRYNASGCYPNGDFSPSSGNPFFCPGPFAPGPIFITVPPGRYRIADSTPSGVAVWVGDEVSGTRYNPIGGTIDVTLTRGKIVLYYWDWYVYDNPDTISTTVSVYKLPSTAKYDLTLRAFIPVETIDGPGVITKPALNTLFLTNRVAAILGAAAASADGETCNMPPLVQTLRFGGDNRGFASSLVSPDYRAESKATISFDAQQFPSGEVSRAASTGVTKSYAENAFDSSGLLTAASKADAGLNDCNLLHRTGRASSTPIAVTVQKLNDTLIFVTFRANLPNPLVLTSRVIGQIDWNVNLSIDTLNNEYTIAGSSTCYPAFEMYINNTRIFGKLPSDNRFSTLLGCLSEFLPRTNWNTGPLPLPQSN